MNRELVFLRTFAVVTVIGMTFITSTAFNKSGNQKFSEIDVERINIVEKDGTVKMVITNVDRFPNGTSKINNRPTNADRKKRSGMLFFNEEGIECGGFIYDGRKTENGHSAGLSLTYDQYDGDQVMQLLTQDVGKGDKRFVSSTLAFNDRPDKESQLKTMEIMQELEEDEEELLFAALLVGQFIPLDERLPTIQIKCSCAALSSGEDNNVTSIDIASGCCISRF